MRFVVLCSALPLILSFLGCEGCLEEEREALLQIKASINSPEGTAFSTWYGKDCCQWEALECDPSTSHVIKMIFQYQRSSDRSEIWFPNATVFSQFKEIQEIYLVGNNIGGFISPSDLQQLRHLQKLDLRHNSIDNSSYLCWGSIPSLNYLDLSENQLGEFPKCVCQCSRLTTLVLSQNKLSGNIDTCLANMTSLEHLDLSNNLLDGKFPSLLFHNLTGIQSLIISHNLFEDVIALSIFANLSQLCSLDLSSNDALEVETEFPSWAPSFSLTELSLGSCNLNKRSGSNLPSFLSIQHQLQLLDLSHNSLVGSIPSWLFYNVSSQLLIRGNNFSGLFQTAHSNMSSKLSLLDISDNFMNGPLPADISHVFPEIFHLKLSENSFNGTLTDSFSTMKQLKTLDLSGNNFYGELRLSNMSSLEYLILSNNHFEGAALQSNSTLPELKELYLDRNYFSGVFPESISRCSSLHVLTIYENDLSGELSRALPVLPLLRILVLRGNRFEGQIPLRLCQMQNLHILDLSQNYLSGNIPTCVDNISSLKEETNHFDFYHSTGIKLTFIDKTLTFRNDLLNFVHLLDISSNKLTGKIPSQLSKLAAIKLLNLSNNLLTGEIPHSLGNLKSMEGLDLSRNDLFGQIPQDFVDLTALAIFDVSFNNLSGRLPPFVNQFATFEKSSYLGNSQLCGRPLERLCSEQKTPGKAKEKQSNVAARYSTLSTTSAFMLVFHVFLF